MNRPALLIALLLLPLSLAMPSASAVCVPGRSFPANDVAIPAINTPGATTPGYSQTVDPPAVGPADVGPITVGIPSVEIEPTHRDRDVLIEEDTFETQDICVPP